jgi:hypothetical protein
MVETSSAHLLALQQEIAGFKTHYPRTFAILLAAARRNPTQADIIICKIFQSLSRYPLEPEAQWDEASTMKPEEALKKEHDQVARRSNVLKGVSALLAIVVTFYVMFHILWAPVQEHQEPILLDEFLIGSK